MNATKPKDYPPTPALDKMRSVQEQSQAIGTFLDWLRNTTGRTICKWREIGDNGEPRYLWAEGVTKAKLDGRAPADRAPRRSDFLNGDAIGNPAYCEWSDGYIEDNKSIEVLLAEYFEIDLAQCEVERRAVLDYVRGEQS